MLSLKRRCVYTSRRETRQRDLRSSNFYIHQLVFKTDSVISFLSTKKVNRNNVLQTEKSQVCPKQSNFWFLKS